VDVICSTIRGFIPVIDFEITKGKYPTIGVI
jgi:hypothetical protein